MSEQKYAVYSAEDIQVKKDGHVMLMTDVAKELNRKSYIEEKRQAIKVQMAKVQNSDTGIEYSSGLDELFKLIDQL